MAADTDKIPVRRPPVRNISFRLRNRETHDRVKVPSMWRDRKFYLNVIPNVTVVNIEKPPGFLRKFTPDGNWLISFSSQQSSVEIFRYRGISRLGNFWQRHLTSCPPGGLIHEAIDSGREVRRQIFSQLLELKHSVQVATGNEQLNRECSLFSSDSRFVIVAAAGFIPDDLIPQVFDVYRNNESLSPVSSLTLEDYSIHCVDINEGRLCDTVTFKCDKIQLSHNQGLYLCGRTLAVLSIQHQTIHLYRLTDEGQLMELRQIGRFCSPDDETFLSLTMSPSFSGDGRRNQAIQPMAEPFIGGLKHRVLTFLLKRALQTFRTGGDNRWAVRNFYRNFDYFRWLRIWRLQMLDETHLLLRYASEDVVVNKVDSNTQNSFFVVVDISESEVEILGVYENVSEEFLSLYERHADEFRLPLGIDDGSLAAQPCCSVASSIFARQNHERFKMTICNAKFGGKIEATKRILSQLPISCQSFCPSPYLDLELFSYDDKWISLMERPKSSGEFPVRFYERDSGRLSFQLHCGLAGRVPPAVSHGHKNLVAFVFHPYEPLAISVQRTNRDYVVNLHLRHSQLL